MVRAPAAGQEGSRLRVGSAQWGRAGGDAPAVTGCEWEEKGAVIGSICSVQRFFFLRWEGLGIDNI